LLNATMGNASEFIVGIFLLKAGHVEIVKASLSGSIIGNTLLVLGMSALIGGIGKEKQTFSRRTAVMNSTMLFIAVVAMILPAVYSISVFGTFTEQGAKVETVSQWTSGLLVFLYGLSLLFMMQHRTLTPEKRPAAAPGQRRIWVLLLALATSTVMLALISDILVSNIEQTKSALGWSDLFMGVIVVAIVGNAAEHASALVFAKRDKMELSVGISAGSSVQIALLVAPLLVLLSLPMHHPMSLVFSPLEIAGIAVAVATVSIISLDGETTWFEGAQLIVVYLIFAICIYLMPVNSLAPH
jgi:Ca2+:H+ antiporter